MKKTRIKQILNLLTTEYGYREWRPNHDPISVLVQTILSQNTSDRNSHRAFASLTASFGSWDNVASASLSQIVDSIRAGGLAEIKAKYIKQALEEIMQWVNGKYSPNSQRVIEVEDLHGKLWQIVKDNHITF